MPGVAHDGCRDIFRWVIWDLPWKLLVTFSFTTQLWLGFPKHLLKVVTVLRSRKLYTSLLEEVKLGGTFILGLEDLPLLSGDNGI